MARPLKRDETTGLITEMSDAEIAALGGGSYPPLVVNGGETWTVPANQQALYATEIEIASGGEIDLQGEIVQVQAA